MSLNSNTKKSQVLGQPYGTACNRLRKMVLFDLLKKLNQNFCFRCNKEISSCDDLTIEHKQTWLDKGKEYFWNLENISFSHSSCNVAYIEKNSLEDNSLICSKCKERKPLSDFKIRKYNSSSIRKFYSYWCQSCERKDWLERWYKNGYNEKRNIRRKLTGKH